MRVGKRWEPETQVLGQSLPTPGGRSFHRAGIAACTEETAESNHTLQKHSTGNELVYTPPNMLLNFFHVCQKGCM